MQGSPVTAPDGKKTSQKTCGFFLVGTSQPPGVQLRHQGWNMLELTPFVVHQRQQKPWNALSQLLIRIKFPQPWAMMDSQLSDVNLKPCMPYSAFVPKLNDIIVPMHLAYVNIFKTFAQASPHHKCPTMPLFSVLGSSMKCASPSVSPPHSQHFTSFSHHFPMIFHHVSPF